MQEVNQNPPIHTNKIILTTKLVVFFEVICYLLFAKIVLTGIDFSHF